MDNLKTKNQVKYNLNENGEFTISNYNSAKLFSSFFPGVAGRFGKPMWLFYVNRGQCVCSMGVDGKHNPIMEFLPANRAYQLTSSQGFRTFIKILSDQQERYYEPFQSNLADRDIARTQKMKISPSQLTLEEENETLGLSFSVKYFNIPQDTYSGLARILTIRNNTNENIQIEGLDGLPLIIPYGIDNAGLKFMRRLMEAFVEVANYENGVPFFRGKVKPTDTPEVLRIKKGNFYLGFEQIANEAKLIRPIVDPMKIFGSQSNYSYPEEFLTKKSDSLYDNQILENRLPCSMGFFKTSIPAGGSYTYFSIIGHAASINSINSLIPKIMSSEYVRSKEKEDKQLIDKLTQKNFIFSKELFLNHYTKQNFLDNTLRGGFPYTFKSNKKTQSIHLFSRKHGDLERDYNDYRLSPTYYSQGNGNFRDVNQNRRNDLFFNPDVKESNVVHFSNLIQLDGFNPLVIKETRFKVKEKECLNSILSEFLEAKYFNEITRFFEKSFTPGEIMEFLEEQNAIVRKDKDTFIANLMAISKRVNNTGYGESYWTDHWTYNLDLLENYLAIFPEKIQHILYEKNDFTFYDNPHVVKSRDDKYVIWNNTPMQLDSVFLDEQKQILINSRKDNKNVVRTNYGNGQIYYTSLINKMISIIVNKMASLDPEGIGVEMESGKPNWYDALNGLPGLFGSSLNETLEIKRLILFLQDAIKKTKTQNKKWYIYVEIKNFFDELHILLKKDSPTFEYWDKSAALKENYREKTRLGISGDEKVITIKELQSFLSLSLFKLEKGIEKAWDKEKGVVSTYFANEVAEYQEIKIYKRDGKIENKINEKGLHCIQVTKFKQKPLPLFLEGPVHYLRCLPKKQKAQKLYDNIKNSGLYDGKLKMYKVNESLRDEVPEIGRAHTFSPGWFENESIWLHMEYKYMLELIRNKLYDEFYSDFKNVFVPFFKPEVYGRSILENSSFIVSSANPDPSIHGNGFVARLSGATAEFIHIMILMTVGETPFRLNENSELELHLQPSLPDWLFTDSKTNQELILENKNKNISLPENAFSFMFLSSILVTYINPTRKNTYGLNSVQPAHWEIIDKEGHSTNIKGNVLKGDIVRKIRDRQIDRINIELA